METLRNIRTWVSENKFKTVLVFAAVVVVAVVLSKYGV